MTGALFNDVAGNYATSRPTYPDTVYDTVRAAAGRPFTALTVLDVGAGTGIATAAMARRGATVTAVDPATEMLAQLAAAVPTATAIPGDGNALPLDDAGFDLVTYAQSLHWTDPARSIPEALRVLRPDGLIAAWWNIPDFEVPWVAAQADRLRQAAPTYHGFAGADIGPGLGRPPFDLDVANHEFRWSRRITVDQHITMLGTQSYLAALAPDPRAEFLAAEARQLREAFPDGALDEPYVTRLTVAQRR
jgi:ubiquinone/menaquinone biosynthesis C-methylase UbiE